MTIQIKFDMLNDREAGLSYQQLAEKYNVPLGTVKSRVNRARASMNNSMQENENVSEDEVQVTGE